MTQQSRAAQAPEMTPAVDGVDRNLPDPGSKPQPAEGGRDEVDDRPEPRPGEVPGLAGTIEEGSSTLARDEAVVDERGEGR